MPRPKGSKNKKTLEKENMEVVNVKTSELEEQEKLEELDKLRKKKTAVEPCRNPWKPECVNEDIKLYIQIKDEKYPICDDCWKEIAVSDEEWGEPTPKLEETEITEPTENESETEPTE